MCMHVCMFIAPFRMPCHPKPNPSANLQTMKQIGERTLRQLRTEIVALKALRHPNILELFHVETNAIYLKKSGLQVRMHFGVAGLCVLPLIVGCDMNQLYVYRYSSGL